MDEPSVLDYLKSKLDPRRRPVMIPGRGRDNGSGGAPIPGDHPPRPDAQISRPFPWQTLLALGFALIAQFELAPPHRDWKTGLGFYGVALVFGLWAAAQGGWLLPSLAHAGLRRFSWEVRPFSLIAGAIFLLAAFFFFGGNRFTIWNLTLWAAGGLFVCRAFWVGDVWNPREFLSRRNFPHGSDLDSRWFWWVAALLGVGFLVMFFHVAQLDRIPPEMTSDHAEKLMDLSDVLRGQTRIFFTRNTGREPVFFYLSALVASVGGTGLSFLTLKIAALTGLLVALFFLFRLGVEIGNRRVGLLAVLFAGIAYWPNVITRFALRFSLYPMFAAPALFYLIRGLRRMDRNDFIKAGVAVGLGLMGYTAFRIVPLTLVIILGIFLIHRAASHRRWEAILSFGILGFVAVGFALPLLRYSFDNPGAVFFRSLTRLAAWERPLPGPPLQILLNNLGDVLTMFWWSNGDIWVHSVMSRPALDVVSAALFFMGIILLLVRYARQRHWEDLALLGIIPLLLLPSALSLAFPEENPSLNRTAGAMVPVFLIVGLALDGLLIALKSRVNSFGRFLAGGVLILLVIWSSAQNYDLVFRQYREQYDQFSWNASEMASVIGTFLATFGDQSRAYVVAYPYWVDTRLVGMQKAAPFRDYTLFPDEIEKTRRGPEAKLYIFYLDDLDTLEKLQDLYPDGVLQRYRSRLEIAAKDFLTFYVLPEAD